MRRFLFRCASQAAWIIEIAVSNFNVFKNRAGLANFGGQQHLWRNYEALRRIAEGMDHRNETNMNTPLEMRPSLGSPSVRKLGRASMTRAGSKHSIKRLFIAVSAFEFLDFPVRVRSVESLGNKLCRTTVRVIRP
jgi:hypothetical protein